jgi:alanine racemase
MNPKECSTWLEINLTAIASNVTLLRQITGVMVMAVVKANGYGHGAVEVARAALMAGASWLGVARLEEALVLRQAGITAPILVTSFTAPTRIVEAAVAGVALTVYDLGLACAYSRWAATRNVRLSVHAKIDTSMGRLGVFPEQGVDFMRRLIALPGLSVEGIFTHFATADEPQKPDMHNAINRFISLLDQLRPAGLLPPLVHAANSAAALYFPQARFGMVRCGISIYGLHPSDEAPLPEGFRPALTWKTRLQSVKLIPPGHGIGYNARYVTNGTERIGAVAVGYADGFRRRLGNFALVGGQRVPTAGGICMDQCMLQLDSVPKARLGDEVVLIGKQGQSVITAEEVAQAWGTVNYEVTCGLAARLPRFYVGF